MGKLNFTTQQINDILQDAKSSLPTDSVSAISINTILTGIDKGLAAHGLNFEDAGAYTELFTDLFRDFVLFDTIRNGSEQSEEVLANIRGIYTVSGSSVDFNKVLKAQTVIIPSTDGTSSLWNLPSGSTAIDHRVKVINAAGNGLGYNILGTIKVPSGYSYEVYAASGTYSAEAGRDTDKRLALIVNKEWIDLGTNHRVVVYNGTRENNITHWDLVIKFNPETKVYSFYWTPLV